VRDWFAAYKGKFNEEPGLFSAYGYVAMDMFVQTAKKTGPNLSTDSFIKTMDTMKIPPDIFGSAELTFSPTKRLGSNATRLSQLQDARWKVVSEYMSIK
jgi:branched-chain amino acid transport system substrate-binding protein